MLEMDEMPSNSVYIATSVILDHENRRYYFFIGMACIPLLFLRIGKRQCYYQK